jgi:hypothetical protein
MNAPKRFHPFPDVWLFGIPCRRHSLFHFNPIYFYSSRKTHTIYLLVKGRAEACTLLTLTTNRFKMRELSNRASSPVTPCYLYSKAATVSLREISVADTSPWLRTLTLTLGFLLFTIFGLQAQYTLSKIDPTCQIKTNGQITVSNLVAGTTYTYSVISSGTPIPGGTFTANASGQFIFGSTDPLVASGLARGNYQFTIVGQSPQRTIALYDLTTPLSATSTLVCPGNSTWVNPFHNDEALVFFDCNNNNIGVSSDLNYLSDGTLTAGAGIIPTGYQLGCPIGAPNLGCAANTWEMSSDPNMALAANSYYEFDVTVSSLKFDLTHIYFKWYRDTNGPKRWGVFVNGVLLSTAPNDVPVNDCGLQTLSVPIRTYQPGDMINVKIVGYRAASPAGLLIIDDIQLDSDQSYNFYGGPSLTPVLASFVDSFQTPPILVPTTYYIEATADGGCKSEPFPYTVNLFPAPQPTITPSPSASICAGQSTTLTVTSSVTGETYAWNTVPVQTTSSITVSTAGTYVVTVTNSSGCSATASQVVTVNALPVVNITGNTTICSNQTTTLTATAGFTYQWNTTPVQTGRSIIVSTAGTYIVTATNTNNCTSTDTITVTVNAVPTANITGPMVSCSGSTIVLTANTNAAGNTFQWSANTLNSTATTVSVAPTVNPTVYTVTVTNAANCTASATHSVVVNALPTISIVSSSGLAICAGTSTTLTASGAGLVGSYAWNTTPAQTGATINVNTAGTYTVTGTDANGCFSTAQITISVTALPVAAIAGDLTICNGELTTLTASGGTYQWSFGNLTSASIQVSPSTTTPYTVTVTANGCSATTSATVTVFQLPTASISGNLSICIGASTILTGTGGDTYQWAPTVTTQTYTVAPTVTSAYILTVTDNNGCTDTETATVVVNPLPVVTFMPSSSTICFGGMATITASGGDTYAWSNNDQGPVLTDNPIVTTVYTVTVTNNMTLCQNTGSVTVTVTPLPVITITPNQSICAGQTATITATGGGTYTWSNTPMNIATNAVTPAATTTYTVTVTTNACSSTASSTVMVNNNPSVTIAGNLNVCIGSATTLTANPMPVPTATTPYTYLWDTPATTQSISPTPAGPTSYSVVVRDINGCTGSSSALVNTLPVPSVVFSGVQTICAGQSTTITAISGGGSSFLWDANVPVAMRNMATITVSPANTTTYSVTVTGANNCTTVGTIAVTVNPLPIAAIAGATTVCQNGTTTLTATGGGTYQWSANVTSANGATAVVSPSSAPVVYTVTVTDLGCSAIASITITTVAAPTATINAPSTTVCKGTSITLTASGGTMPPAFPYNWSNSGNTAAITVSPAVTTTFTVTVTNSANCTDTESVTIQVINPPIANGVVTPPSCVNGTDGSINITVTSGAPITNFIWSTPNGSGLVQGAEDQTALTPGDYMVIIQNGSGCDIMLMFTVPVATANNDHTPPTIECDSLMIFCPMQGLTPADLSALGIGGAIPTVTDNCTPTSMITLTNTITNQIDVTCTDLIDGKPNISYVVDYTWSAKDNNNNSASCVSRIYYQRIQNNQIVYPGPQTYSCTNPTTDPASAGVPVFNAYGQSWPLFPNAGFCELNLDTIDRISPICDGSYKITRTWNLFNWCSTNESHDQIITVMDTGGPTFACPSNITVSTNGQTCNRDYNLPDILIDDACSNITSFFASWVAGGMSMLLNGTLETFPGNNLWLPDTMGVMGTAAMLPVGTTTITYTVRDDCNNITTCTFNVTVVDDIPPVASCKSPGMQISLNAPEAYLNATTLNNNSTDNCAPVFFKVRRMDANTCQPNNQFYDKVKFCCEDKGDTITVILRVYDIPVPSGPVDLTFEEAHSNECMTTVIVLDKLKPTCPPVASVTIHCDAFDPTLWSYDTLKATDNCGMVTTTSTANYANFDAMCKQGQIVRTFVATDMVGLTCSATQTITVVHKQDYFIKFPDDVLSLTCNGPVTAQSPIIFDEDCELGGVSLVKDDTIRTTLGACYEIIRSWRVSNLCTYNPTLPCTLVPNPNPSMMMNDPANLPGPVVAPLGSVPAPTSVKILPTDLAPTNYTTFWTSNANCYEYKQRIKVSDVVAPTFINCPAGIDTTFDLTENDPTLWNAMHWYDAVHNTHNLGEAPVNLPATAIDGCSGTNLTMTYQLFLDLDGNGTMETVVNSANPPVPGTVNFNNVNTPNFAGGVNRAFDHRIVPVSQKYQFALEQAVVGGNVVGFVRWNTISSPNTFVQPQLPYGKHKVKWFVNDGCGNQSVCEYLFTIVDGKAPNVTLISLSTNMMPTGMAPIFLDDLLFKLSDNMSDSADIKVSMAFAPSTTFPLVGGQPVTQLIVQCPTVGTVNVVVWAMDLAGNMTSVPTTVIVTDNQGVCGASNKVMVAGSLDGKDKNGVPHGVQNANVTISGTHPVLPPLQATLVTNQIGQYNFGNSVPVGGNYMVTPIKNDDHSNGVNVLDVLLMQRHILGLAPLATPYQIIAADVNKSGSVTSNDIVELRKLILGACTELPQNTSWRFIDKAHQFSNPFNPFADNFKEYLSWQNIQTNQDDACFEAVKVGDLNNSVLYNNLMQTDDRSAATLYFETNDRNVTTGEVFEVPFSLSDDVMGYQFTLNYEGLELEEVIPTDIRFTKDHFAVFADKRAITFACDVAGKSGFTLRFRAKSSDKISNLITLNSRITEALATNKTGDRFDIATRFNGTDIQTAPFVVYQNAPNPMSSSTLIGFHMPEAGEATLTITDELGRTIHVAEGQYSKGYQTFEVFRAQLSAKGLYFYTIRIDGQQATMRMIVD